MYSLTQKAVYFLSIWLWGGGLYQTTWPDSLLPSCQKQKYGYMTCLLACELFLYHITGKHDKFSLRGRPNVKYEIQEGGGIICVTARGVCKTQVCRFAGLQVCRSAGGISIINTLKNATHVLILENPKWPPSWRQSNPSIVNITSRASICINNLYEIIGSYSLGDL